MGSPRTVRTQPRVATDHQGGCRPPAASQSRQGHLSALPPAAPQRNPPNASRRNTMSTFSTPEFRRRAFLAGLGALSTSALVTACGGTTASTGAGSTTPVDGGNITFLIQGYDTGWVSSKTSI